MKLLDIQDGMAAVGPSVFTGEEFAGFMKVSRTAAQKLLERYSRKGVFIRLRKGYYMLKSRPAHSFSISNKIYRPSYVSFESALSFHCMIPETVYEITAATTKPTRNFSIGGKSYTYHKIKKEAYTGYEPVKIGLETVYIASPEKSLADHLYMVNLGRASLHERLNLKKVDLKKASRYVGLFDRPELENLLATVAKEGAK